MTDPTDCKTVLRQLMAQAIDARDALAQAENNPAFEPEDRDALAAIVRGLNEALEAASAWQEKS